MSAPTAGTRRITAGDVDALAAGATLLGSGGGGAVAVGQRLLRHRLADRTVPLVPVTDLADDDVVVHVGVVGGPDVIAERLVDPEDLSRAARAVADATGGRLDAVGCIEVGGLNALIAVLAAAHLRLPVVDGDLMGRAFPSIRMTTLALAGEPVTPLAVVDAHHDVVVVQEASVARAEAMVAAVVGAMGGAGAIAMYPATAATLASTSVRGTLSACRDLGHAYRHRRSGSAPALASALGARLLVEGRVAQIRPQSGSEPGSVTLTVDSSRTTARVDHRDEFLAVTRDGVTVSAVPEVIVALDSSNRSPLRCDEIRLGQSLVVCSLPALHAWPPEAQDLIGPRGFGLVLEAVS